LGEAAGVFGEFRHYCRYFPVLFPDFSGFFQQPFGGFLQGAAGCACVCAHAREIKKKPPEGGS